MQKTEKNKPLDIIVVPHTHWDREWYATFQQFRFQLVEMMDQLIDILKKDKTFTHFLFDGQTIPLEDYLEIRPKRFKDLKMLIGEGRIAIGPWYLQPDEQLVSGESLIRNLMLGHKIAGRFGRVMKEGYLPDTFGHVAQLPQILRGFDIPSFFLMRGLAEDLEETGSEFWWQAPDGSRVLAHYMISYSNAPVLEPTPEATHLHRSSFRYDSLYELRDCLHDLASTNTLLFLNGNDHLGIQVDLPEIVRSLDQHMPDNLTLGSLAEFRNLVESKRSDFKVVHGELTSGRYQKIVQGVLSTRMYLKQMNAHVQNLLERLAEPLGTVIWILGYKYPASWLCTAWKWLLQNHAHDSIAGCSIDQVHREMVCRFAQARDIGAELVEYGLGILAANVDASFDEAKDELAVIVFNSTQYKRDGIVTVPIDPYIGYPFGVRTFSPAGFRAINLAEYVAEYDTGEIFPVTVAGGVLTSEDIRNRRKVLVKQNAIIKVREVPGMGYKVVRLRPAQSDERAASGLMIQKRSIENEFFRVEAAKNGALQIFDKTAGVTYNNMNYFENTGDAGDEYTYSPVGQGAVDSLSVYSALTEILDRRPVEVVLRVKQELIIPISISLDRKSRVVEKVSCMIKSEIRLRDGLKRIDIVTTVNNKARDHRLRVVFPAGFNVDKCYAESSFCVVSRPTVPGDGKGWIEKPVNTRAQRRFVAVDHVDGSRGIAILNKGITEYEVTPTGDIKLTLLRCVGWLSRDDLKERQGGTGPPFETPDAQCGGEHRFEYSIVPYQGTWKQAQIWKSAEDFTIPLVGIRVRHSDRQLPSSQAFLTLVGDGLILTAVKKAEEEDAMIVRLFNILTEATSGVIETFRPLSRAFLVNLNEEDREILSIENGARVRLTVQANQIVILKLWFKKNSAGEMSF